MLFVLPIFIYHFMIVIVPSAKTLFYAFYDWNGIRKGTFIGLGNFTEMANDPVLKKHWSTISSGHSSM